MKILDLGAQFIVPTDKDGHRVVDSFVEAQGVTFQCPKCSQGRPRRIEKDRRFVQGAHYVILWFEGVSQEHYPIGGRWMAAGKGLHDLTLSPSIHIIGNCNWHGWVQDGNATF